MCLLKKIIHKMTHAIWFIYMKVKIRIKLIHIDTGQKNYWLKKSGYCLEKGTRSMLHGSLDGRGV